MKTNLRANVLRYLVCMVVAYFSAWGQIVVGAEPEACGEKTPAPLAANEAGNALEGRWRGLFHNFDSDPLLVGFPDTAIHCRMVVEHLEGRELERGQNPSPWRVDFMVELPPPKGWYRSAADPWGWIDDDGHIRLGAFGSSYRMNHRHHGKLLEVTIENTAIRIIFEREASHRALRRHLKWDKDAPRIERFTRRVKGRWRSIHYESTPPPLGSVPSDSIRLDIRDVSENELQEIQTESPWIKQSPVVFMASRGWDDDDPISWQAEGWVRDGIIQLGPPREPRDNPVKHYPSFYFDDSILELRAAEPSWVDPPRTIFKRILFERDDETLAASDSDKDGGP